MTMGGFTAIALWNVIELNLNIFMTFRKRQGLYFWALLISSWGVIGHALSLVFKFLTDFNPYWVCTLLMLGWWAMVSPMCYSLRKPCCLTTRIGQRPVPGPVLTAASCRLRLADPPRRLNHDHRGRHPHVHPDFDRDLWRLV